MVQMSNGPAIKIIDENCKLDDPDAHDLLGIGSCGHYHDKCNVITNFEERKDIGRKNLLCYKYLISGHNILNCRNKKLFSL